MLREKLIDYLNKYPESVDMEIWVNKDPDELARRKIDSCGTIGCFAGLIYHVSNFQYNFCYDDDYKKMINHPRYNFWNEYERSHYQTTSIYANIARMAWEEEYGTEAAKSLPFYEEFWIERYGCYFFEISARHLLEWLKEDARKELKP